MGIKMDVVKSVLSEKKLITNNNRGCSVSSTYVNFSKHYLAVCFRDGCYTILSPNANSVSADLLVIEHNKTNFTDGILTVDGDEDPILNHIKENLTKSNGKHVTWEERVDITDIVKARGGVYISNLDVYVGIATQMESIHFHPYSYQHTLNSMLNHGEDFDTASQISIRLQIIDNQKPGVDYYTVLNNNIVHLKSERSMIKGNGFYISGMPEIQSAHANKLRCVQIVSLEKAFSKEASFTLFTTLAEATVAVNENIVHSSQNKLDTAQHEKTILEIKREVELLQQENQLLNTKRVQKETELKEYKVEQEKVQQDIKFNYDLRLQQLKEEATIKSGEAKSTMEYYKLAGAALGFGLLVAKLI
jgi:hypothetical protein